MNKLYQYAILLYLFSLPFSTVAQAPFRYFTDTPGDQLYDIEPVGQNGYITCGISSKNAPSSGNILVLRINNQGDTLWSRVFDSSDPTGEYAMSAIALNDNTFIISGNSSSGAYLMKLDSAGGIVWKKTYSMFNIQDAILTSDGKLALTGTASGCMFSKLDLNGNILICKYFPAPGYGASGHHIKETSNGDFIIAGYLDYGLTEAFAMRLDANGTLIWDKTYVKYTYCEFYDVIETRAGDLIFAGQLITSMHAHLLLLVKTDANGNVVWSKTFNAGEFSTAMSLAKTGNNTFLASGDLLLSLDENGNSFWCRQPNGIIYASVGLNNGFVALAGVTFNLHSQILVVDPIGNTGCMDSNQTTVASSTIICTVRNASVTETALNVTVSASTFTVYSGSNTLKPCSIPTAYNEILKTNFQIFPNPWMTTFTIKREYGTFEELIIKDLMGKTVLKQEINNNETEITIDTDWPKGVYLLQIGNRTEKLLKL